MYVCIWLSISKSTINNIFYSDCPKIQIHKSLFRMMELNSICHKFFKKQTNLKNMIKSRKIHIFFYELAAWYTMKLFFSLQCLHFFSSYPHVTTLLFYGKADRLASPPFHGRLTQKIITGGRFCPAHSQLFLMLGDILYCQICEGL